jgi:hypothetical protein
MSSSDIIVGYNKNDFFYVNALHNGEMPNASVCRQLDVHNKIWNTKCNKTNFVDNSGNCLKKELCINQEYANKLQVLQQKYSGSDEKYSNATDIHEQTVAQTINLAGGIILILLLMFKVTMN